MDLSDVSETYNFPHVLPIRRYFPILLALIFLSMCEEEGDKLQMPKLGSFAYATILAYEPSYVTSYDVTFKNLKSSTYPKRTFWYVFVRLRAWQFYLLVRF